MVDATIVKVHHHGQRAKADSSQAIGRSKGGMTTKILALTDALGNLVRFVLLLRMVSDTPARAASSFLERSQTPPCARHSSATTRSTA